MGCGNVNGWGTPLPPLLLKILLGAGFTKNVCKILIANNLDTKILTTKELGAVF